MKREVFWSKHPKLLFNPLHQTHKHHSLSLPRLHHASRSIRAKVQLKYDGEDDNGKEWSVGLMEKMINSNFEYFEQNILSSFYI